MEFEQAYLVYTSPAGLTWLKVGDKFTYMGKIGSREDAKKWAEDRAIVFLDQSEAFFGEKSRT